MPDYKDENPYDQAVSDCWVYLYYELGMKDLANEMEEWVSSQRKAQSDDQQPMTEDQEDLRLVMERKDSIPEPITLEELSMRPQEDN